jgi:flagellar biosynthesis protein FlhF
VKIKKYTGSTTHEAMLKLKRELGSDAVVLNTKTVKPKGIFGFLKRSVVEITAAYEEKNMILPTSNINYDNKLNHINNELSELKILMESISKKVAYDEASDLFKLKPFHDILVTNGVDHNISSKILEEINQQINIQNKDEITIKNIIRYNLMEYLGYPKSLSIDENQKVVFFVGPTGVGKTTTLAKIAAKLVLENKYKIGLITCDTYRISAVDQLKTYSDILELPLEIAYNQEDMIKALTYFKDKDIILVDTAGRNHKDVDQREDLKKIIETANKKETYLVLSAATELKTLNSIVNNYSFIEDFKIIFTKVDETETYGNLFNIRYITKKELSYITTGQNVPDDIEVLDKKVIVEKLIGENEDDRSSR